MFVAAASFYTVGFYAHGVGLCFATHRALPGVRAGLTVSMPSVSVCALQRQRGTAAAGGPTQTFLCPRCRAVLCNQEIERTSFLLRRFYALGVGLCFATPRRSSSAMHAS